MRQRPAQQSPIGYICNNQGVYGIETSLIPMWFSSIRAWRNSGFPGRGQNLDFAF